MFFFKLLSTLIAVLSLIFYATVADVAKQINGDVQLVETGTTDLIIPDELSFTVSQSCQGVLRLCYVAESVFTPGSEKRMQNVNSKCPSGTCMIQLNIQEIDYPIALLSEQREGNVIATFDGSQSGICPMKAGNDRQTFTVLELPTCPVTVIGASLPQSDSDSGKSNFETTNAATDEEGNLKWIIIMGVGIVIALLFLCGFFGYIGYQHWKDSKTNAPNPQNQRQNATPAASPMAPTSPATFPTVSPSTPKTPAKSPATVETPKREAESKAQTEDQTTTVASVVPKSVVVKVPELPAIEMVEESFDAMYRVKLIFIGMRETEARKQLKTIHKKYNTRLHRQTAVFEIEFFLTFVSEAYKDGKKLILYARTELYKHGAVFDHGQWRSFNETTRQYISRPSTPGFIASYAMACECGNEIKFDSQKHAKSILAKLSAPALLTVYFRENLPDQIRRSAYAHLRRMFSKVVKHFSDTQMYALPYPVCLFPDLRKKNERLFLDAENDKTYSTPFELITQRKKDEATVNEDSIDETQVSHSHSGGWKKDPSVPSVSIVMGSRAAATATVQMD